ncbi:MAG: signal recognition particle-docking protein FtsY [Proteobacteria bacterium]|nr:MAG: signal recognition particle-docking protein FtsY [Pseudomonadota bacterium]
MQTIELIFIALSGLLALVFVFDLVKSRRGIPKYKKVEQRPKAEATTREAETVQPDSPVAPPARAPEPEAVPPSTTPPASPPLSVMERIRQGLTKTRNGLTRNLSSLILGSKTIDRELLEEIETMLLTADVGVAATQQIIANITDRLERNQLSDPSQLDRALQDELTALLSASEQPLSLETGSNTGKKPFVMLVVGVNGAGKTTTIGKLAKKFQNDGKTVMLAAGDTFRAAAVEQLQVWGERNDVPVVAQHTGADSASVIFDAVQSAQAKNIDIVIADTAGRLQNKDNLMAELEKVVRVMKKLDDTAPHEVLLVLDAGTGQNALSQARLFKQAVGVSGIALTKLDGTARGGIIFAIAKQFDLPIRYIGVGEQIDDLRPFHSGEFVSALFEK